MRFRACLLVVIPLLWIAASLAGASELSFFSPFGSPYIITPQQNNAAKASFHMRLETQPWSWDLENPHETGNMLLTKTDAAGLFTDTSVSGKFRDTIAPGANFTYDQVTPYEEEVFDPDWHRFADRLVPDIWKDTMRSTLRDENIKDVLLWIADVRHTRYNRKTFQLWLEESSDHNAESQPKKKRGINDPLSSLPPYSNRFFQPHLPPEHRTEHFKGNEEEKGLLFGFKLNTTTLILLGVGILVVAVICKRLPY